ncbi:DNA-(apurinic or apyrimidinic site) lyase [Candidatus Ruthia magnifica str. Cm (Calyptogena magnifica)]|uniref:Formamidopyrimidine-DNA glycosylase n=1 Tax=Ruthia magnifica subsp. Calyptogena magnifica TaxID=413404 RepID=FPG_RUTMC|nr:bifunctional DNA-formamidopyrimidine glycosylase/DNA-(apurinic or apyrimidinic site) lyase [Candidatus Ruthturnera calyptogenae]A1AW02.1 RecName: Full=Formamidopyrimidine-DNA glycosylase; Short=Fapy-DNA glycosylase; AltName: Full=DNA-(apurinic or apyrimidinic site) lyase MutM; Short=AP lyase MutM [Candidatus Ruthia magnifica str. Cm (Calyptogena magnifica)]ABL02109.1 DNA-(apurinic or apyrimidinic site) lyase [Candidatus Ruthia magnifica str. Cm (Calyptogena magnifica)]
MPELPEVEITKRGLVPLIINQEVSRVILHRENLRWAIPKNLITILANQKIKTIKRRAKYLLIKFEAGTLIIHLGMSGSIKVVDIKTPLLKHEHFELQFNNGTSMRLNDPRRFGAVLFSKDGSHKLLDSLGVEPLEAVFNNGYLYQKSRNKRKNIKDFIMDSKIVVGVGNIYACESLFMASINPQRKAGNVSKTRYKILTQCIKDILTQAIKAGGTTLQDFSQVDGNPGYFTQTLSVYGCENKTCHFCKSKIIKIVQNQRSTFYCRKCQT